MTIFSAENFETCEIMAIVRRLTASHIYRVRGRLSPFDISNVAVRVQTVLVKQITTI